MPSPVHHHPHLLLDPADLEPLRGRAAQSPWREWRDEALATAPTLVDQPELDPRGRAENLALALSVNSLAHLLDPADPTHATRLVTMVEAFDEDVPTSVTAVMRANPDKMLWLHAVPSGNAFVHAVLALDLVHDHLDPADVRRLEDLLRRGPARYFRETPLAWRQGTLAATAIWALYERDTLTAGPVVERWWADVRAGISPDGVFSGGTGYAVSRWTSPDREHKAFFGEILARAGWLPDWYAEPQLGLFQEWLHGYAFTPSRRLWTVGDSAPTAYVPGEHTGPQRAHRYSALAGRYASWLTQAAPVPPRLAGYVLTDAPLPPPAVAPSRVFPDGGAWLKETSPDERSLAAALLNQRHSHDGHSHKETNAVVLAAYGELLLRAGGYNGWADGEGGFSWDYVHDRAVAASTVLLDHPVPTTDAEERSPSPAGDHLARSGSGITVSLLTGRVDAAEGHSGGALATGLHRRVLVFVHPHDGAAGYYATFDEISGDAATAQVVWHPPSDQHEETVPDLVHTWTTTEHVPAGVGLSVVLATPPARTTLHAGFAASWGHGRPGRYLVGHYPVQRDTATRVLTVLLPHDADHPCPPVARADVAGATGVLVQHEHLTDLLLSCGPDRLVAVVDGVSVRGRGCLVRRRGSEVVEVWVTAATELATGGLRLRAQHPVTAYLRGGVLRTACVEAGTLEVATTDGSALTEVLVDGRPVPRPGETGPGWTVALEAGDHVIEVIRGA